MQAIHVIPVGGGWESRAEGSDEALSRHELKMDAVEAGRELARREQATLVVHRRDGSVHARVDCRDRRRGSLRI